MYTSHSSVRSKSAVQIRQKRKEISQISVVLRNELKSAPLRTGGGTAPISPALSGDVARGRHPVRGSVFSLWAHWVDYVAYFNPPNQILPPAAKHTGAESHAAAEEPDRKPSDNRIRQITFQL